MIFRLSLRHLSFGLRQQRLRSPWSFPILSSNSEHALQVVSDWSRGEKQTRMSFVLNILFYGIWKTSDDCYIERRPGKIVLSLGSKKKQKNYIVGILNSKLDLVDCKDSKDFSLKLTGDFNFIFAILQICPEMPHSYFLNIIFQY